MAAELGFTSADCTLIATVTSELARNLLRHAGGGTAILELGPDGIAIVTEDQGDGIPEARDLFQPGHGLWAVRNGVNQLTIEPGAGGRGARVTARKLLRSAPVTSCRRVAPS